MLKALYQPNGDCFTSKPGGKAAFSAGRACSATAGEASELDRCAYGYSMTRFVFTCSATFTISAAAFCTADCSPDSSAFSTETKAHRHSSMRPAFSASASSGAALRAFFVAVYSMKSECTRRSFMAGAATPKVL
jgi:hypothetical protein